MRFSDGVDSCRSLALEVCQEIGLVNPTLIMEANMARNYHTVVSLAACLLVTDAFRCHRKPHVAVSRSSRL